MRQIVAGNASAALDQDDYQRRYDALVKRYKKAKQRLEEIATTIDGKKAKSENINIFMKKLKAQENLLTEFDEELWNALIDNMIVHSENNITFIFKDGFELDWEM